MCLLTLLSRRSIPGLLTVLLLSAPQGLGAAVLNVVQGGVVPMGATGSGGAPSALVETETGAWVLGATGASRLELPAGSWVNRYTETATGWVAGGTRTSAGARELFLITGTITGATTGDGDPVARAHSIPDHDVSSNERGADGSPPDRSGAVPIVEAGQLIGLAWFEGAGVDDRAVRAARFNERRWEAAETVAPGVVGGQVALSATVLDDGSWLLVWSRLDGGVSQTYWSRRELSGRWTAPRAVDPTSSAHEITPTVVACRGTALVARSRLEVEGTSPGAAHYALRLSRFDGARWVESEVAGSEAAGTGSGTGGALDPTLVPVADGCAWLLFEDGGSGGWAILDIDDAGEVVRRAGVPKLRGGAAALRPVVSAEGGRAVFQWFGDLDRSGAGSEDRRFAPTARLETDWHPVAMERDR